MTDKLENYYKNYDYHTRKPVYIDVEDLTDVQRDRLLTSESFCILPWIHLHAFPDGRAYPCCLGLMEHPVGNLREQTMAEVWNDDPLREMRRNMLADKPCKQCTKCYEQEAAGFVSMRYSQNKNEGHHIAVVDETLDDGTLDRFELKYYDIRFSNLCNLACRTCGDIFSSNWVKEAKKMSWLPQDHPNVQYAGRYEMDMWEQLEPHIDSIENIYFAGGEPLMMAEHYNLLRELLRRGRTDVRLNYNTNFTELVFKQQDVLDMWNEFDIVSIGASLDANYARGELMRKGTEWSKIVANRERMLEKCPTVDFYVSSTLSLMNSYNIVDFHREWVELGLVKPSDWNVNILQDPVRFRLDVLPNDMKAELVDIYNEHIAWLEPQDHLTRATNGFKSAVKYMQTNDNSKLIPEFVMRAKELDRWRNESFFSVFPELERLQDYA
jgi:MoaA/NifB/PqqE/SkfB family radical SAM enzyme